MTTEQQKRTDDLTELADKYNMTVHDRTKLYMLYIEAAQLPPGWVAMPEDPVQQQLSAALKEHAMVHSHSTWQMLKDMLIDQYRRMVKARPNPPPNILPINDDSWRSKKDDKWAEDGSVF
jgi:hypothetical protein